MGMDGSCPHRATGAIVADTSAKAGRMHKNHFDAVARSLSGPQALIPGHGQAYGLGLTQHPTGQAVSAKAGEIHGLDVLHVRRLRKWLTTRRNTAASSSIRVLSSIVIKVLRNTRHKLPRPLGAIPLDQADGIRRLNKRWWQARHHPAGGCRLWGLRRPWRNPLRMPRFLWTPCFAEIARCCSCTVYPPVALICRASAGRRWRR
jgi:hypothetical protein